MSAVLKELRRLFLEWFFSVKYIALWNFIIKEGVLISSDVCNVTVLLFNLRWELYTFCVSTDLFQELFRQDLLVASLFRNFLLAERIMRSYNCTPLSHPQLPATYHHPLWDSWDMALDHCLSQLQGIVDGTETYKVCFIVVQRNWSKCNTRCNTRGSQILIKAKTETTNTCTLIFNNIIFQTWFSKVKSFATAFLLEQIENTVISALFHSL